MTQEKTLLKQDGAKDILHFDEVRAHLEKLQQEHARRSGEAPPPLRARRKRKVNKSITTIRLSHDVLTAFRATGKGWQTRMDAVLKRIVAEGKI